MFSRTITPSFPRNLLHALVLASWIGTASIAASAEKSTDHWRPQLHFTTATDWINDPNGLFRVGDTWHMQYQYRWPRHWGHAESRDLFHWRELPVAIAPDATGDCWSGCTVSDPKNTSGFFQGSANGLVSIYCSRTKEAQHVSLAFSSDGGLTWQRPEGNPVLTSTSPDFRDPKVLWDTERNRWAMVITEGRQLGFFASKDLRHWERTGAWAPANLEPGRVLECPDLFRLPVEGDASREKWVLLVSFLDMAMFKGGTGECATRWLVGDFDGQTFQPEQGADRPSLLGFGPDDYAGITWPRESANGRTLLVGWMNHWQYASKVPTAPWRGCMTLPRELSLRQVPSGTWHLQQNPARELWQLPHRVIPAKSREISERQILGQSSTGAIRGILRPDKTSITEFELFASPQGRTVVGYDAARAVLYFDRKESGSPAFEPDFPTRREVPVPVTADGPLEIEIIFDRSTVEVFANHGATYMSGLVLPNAEAREIAVKASGGKTPVEQLDLWTFEPEPSR